MKKYIILFSLIIFVSCGGGEKNVVRPENEHEHEQEAHEHAHLQLSLEKQKEWGIVVGTATEEDVASKITLPGVISLNQNRTAHISSFVGGKVASLRTDLGYRVKKGQILLTINSPEFAQTQANFLQSMAKLNLSRKEYERAKMLHKEKAIEEREFLRREAEYEKLRTEVGGLGSILHSYGFDHEQTEKLLEKCASMPDDGDLCELANPNLSIRSPLDGIIIFRDVIIGEHVEPDKTLFSASDLSTLWAILDAYEKDLPFIDEQSEVIIKSSLYPNKEFIGKTTYISNLIDEKLRTVKIRAEVENDEGLLKPNLFIQGIIENKAEGKKPLAIPEEAIQSLDGEKIVFVLEEDDIFAACHVELGEKIGTKRLIIHGLKEGDRIVIKGAFYLKAELSKGSFGPAHVH